uniref:Oxidoreductase, 2OG-Fe oxygenase family protein n=1 Tax=Solanum tuberosum TaxID=4113 RepID=M1CK43_SOLTU
MAEDPSSIKVFGALIMEQSLGQRKEATDILALSEFTIALCHILLYFPLLNACTTNNYFI